MNSSHIHTLCYLPPFVSLWKLIVTPVVAYLSDLTVLDGLRACETEVDHIFDHPLEMFLDPTLNEGEILSERGSELWPYKEELHVRHNFCCS
jgi:peroxisomal coenzyme A diphosphatase NUDT7